MDCQTVTPTGFHSWRTAYRQRRFVVEILLTLLVLTVSVWFCMAVMRYGHTRPGTTLNDPIHALIGPVNLRWPVFLVLWSSLIIGFYNLAKTPAHLLRWLQAAAVLTVFRALALYLVPLAPPPTIIPLADPIATLRTGTGDLITNDLFFSGHTAAMFLLFLAMESTRLRWFFLAGFVFIGTAVVIQHVHYCGDAFAAPFFAYGSWRLVLFIHRKMEKNISH